MIIGKRVGGLEYNSMCQLMVLLQPKVGDSKTWVQQKSVKAFSDSQLDICNLNKEYFYLYYYLQIVC